MIEVIYIPLNLFALLWSKALRFRGVSEVFRWRELRNSSHESGPLKFVFLHDGI